MREASVLTRLPRSDHQPDEFPSGPDKRVNELTAEVASEGGMFCDVGNQLPVFHQILYKQRELCKLLLPS